MSKCGYSAVTPTAASVALAAATAKSVLGVCAHANSGLDLLEVTVAYDGVTSTAVPVYTELCYSTFATNAPGTNSTTLASPAITQLYGRAITAGFTAAHTWTSEPTALTVIDNQLLTPNGGLLKWAFPLGCTPDAAVSNGFVIRCKAAAVVNVVATMKVERI